MPITTLANAKTHLRVTHSSEDSLITAYCDAAEAMAEHYCNRSFGSPLPYAVQAAVYLMVGDLYENRETKQDRQLYVNDACGSLLNTVKDWSRSSVGRLPIGVSLDTDPPIIGDDWSRLWRWKNDDGTAIDVTGYTGTFELFDGQFSIHSGSLTVSDAVNGEFSYLIDDAATATFCPGEYWYRARVTSPGGVVTTIIRKRVIIQ